jgi:hypothetical protein
LKLRHRIRVDSTLRSRPAGARGLKLYPARGTRGNSGTGELGDSPGELGDGELGDGQEVYLEVWRQVGAVQ